MNAPERSTQPDAPSSARVVCVGALLLMLAALSWGLSFIELGALSLPCALSIALVKALLVLFTFMELGRRSASVRLALLAAALLILTLGALMAADISAREPSPLPASFADACDHALEPA